MNVQVVIINGPAGSGKDELTAHAIPVVSKLQGTTHQEFKAGLYEEVCKYFNINLGLLMRLLERDLKDSVTEHIKIGGSPVSPRAGMIHVSENVIKPSYGRSFFGDSAVKRLQPGLNIFSDGGFIEELVPIINMVGPENVMILRVIRPGFDFEGDSRYYVDSAMLEDNGLRGVLIDPIFNNGTLQEYLESGTIKILKFVEGRIIEQLNEELASVNLYRGE